MPESFNPYHTWLGLKPDKLTPNHFELLKVKPQADEREFQRAVKASEKRCLDLLARVPPNAHPQWQKKLRQQITLASQILSDPKARQSYLRTLVDQPDSAGATSVKKPAKLKRVKKSRPPNQPDSKPERRSRATPTELLPPGVASQATGNTLDEGTGVTPPASEIEAMHPVRRQQPPQAIPVDRSLPTAPTTAQPRELPQASQPIPVAQPIAQPTEEISGTSPLKEAQAIPDRTEQAELDDAPAPPVINTNAPLRRPWRRVVAERLMQALIIGTLLGGSYFAYTNFDLIKRIANGPTDSAEATPSTSPTAEDIPPSKKVTGDSPPTTASKLNPKAKPPTARPVPTTNPQPAPPSDPEPKPEPKPEPVTRIAGWRFQQTFRGIVRSLQQRRFENAARRLDDLKRSLAETNDPIQAERLAAIEEVSDQTRRLFQRLQTAPQAIEGNRQIVVGEQILGFVEADDSGVLLRNAGSNIRYEYQFIPPGLIIPLIESADIDNVFPWAYEQAVFYALNRTSKSEFENKIRSLMTKAESGGIQTQPLQTFLDYQFDDQEPTAPFSVQEAELLDWISAAAKRIPSKAEQAEAASQYHRHWTTLVAQPEFQADLIEAMILDSIRSGNADLVEDAFAIFAETLPFDVATGHANALLRQFRMSAKKSLTPQQQRTLVEAGFEWMKRNPSASLAKTRLQVAKEISRIASQNRMLDALRRLEQLNSK